MTGETCYVCKMRKPKTSEEYIGFYRFPKCKKRRKQWLDILNLKLKDFESEVTDPRNRKVCSRHFSPDSINFTYPIPRLRDDALPQSKNSSNKKEEMNHGNISANEAPNTKVESTSEKAEGPVCDAEREKFTKPSVNDPPKSEVESLQNSTVLEGVGFNSGIIYFSKKCPNSKGREQGEVSAQTCQPSNESGEEESFAKTGEMRKVDRATSVSPERIMNCPTKEAIRNYYKKELVNEKKARKNVLRKLYASQKRNAYLQDVISKLQSK